MEDKEIKKYVIIALFIILAVLSFLIIKSLFISIFAGLILAYLFAPIYRKLNQKIKSKNICALIIVFFVMIILAIPSYILIELAINNLEKVYNYATSVSDFSVPLQKIFPNLFNSPQVVASIRAMSASFSSKITTTISSAINGLFFNIIPILFNIVTAFFVFFIALRDQDEFKTYFISISPFSKEYQKKFYEKFDQVTYSVIYGELIVGILQGIIAGIGYFICGVPHALLLTFLTTAASILPVIGPWLVWIPIDIYLFLNGNTGSAIGLLIYGLFIINWVDTIIRPLIVSKGAKMNSAIALIGMMGGIAVFGVLGLIIGPLILAYLILLIEAYKEKKISSLILQEENKV